jgi:putative addiction module component (TIGR02574 family)
MTKTELERQVLELPEGERLEVAEAIWASLSEIHPLPAWQKDLLDERLAASEAGPSKDWEDFKAEVWRTSP